MPQDTLLAFLRAFVALHRSLGQAFAVEDARRLVVVLRNMLMYPYDDILLRDSENPTPLQATVLTQLCRLDPTLVVPLPGVGPVRPADDASAAATEGDAASAQSLPSRQQVALRAMILTELADYIVVASRSASTPPNEGEGGNVLGKTLSSGSSTPGATYIAVSLRAMELAPLILNESLHMADLFEDGVIDRLFAVRNLGS